MFAVRVDDAEASLILVLAGPVLVAQPMYELDGKRVGQGRAFAPCEHDRRGFGGVSARAQQAVGETIRLLPRSAAAR